MRTAEPRMPQSTGARPITGDDILSELLRNVESGAFKVRYTTLVPCIFNVYLHADDYEQIRPITGFVRSEAKKALDEHLASLNKASSLHHPLARTGRRQAETGVQSPESGVDH